MRSPLNRRLVTSLASRRRLSGLWRGLSKAGSLNDPRMMWADGSTGWRSMMPASIDARIAALTPAR